MARRWSSEDISNLKNLARSCSIQAIAENMDRTVGGVAFKAHQLGVTVKARSQIETRARMTPDDGAECARTGAARSGGAAAMRSPSPSGRHRAHVPQRWPR